MNQIICIAGPTASGNNGSLPPGEDVLHNCRGFPAVAADGIILPWLCHINHMMGDALPLLRGGLGGADVHALIHLHGVAGHHFTIQFLRQCCGQRGFSRCRRPGDADDVVHK